MKPEMKPKKIFFISSLDGIVCFISSLLTRYCVRMFVHACRCRYQCLEYTVTDHTNPPPFLTKTHYPSCAAGASLAT